MAEPEPPGGRGAASAPDPELDAIASAPDGAVPSAPRPVSAPTPESRLAPYVPFALAIGGAVLVRLLSFGLPIEGDAVAYGALAKSLATGGGYAIDGVAHDRYPPGHPAVLALVLLFGGTVTGATRALGLVLGAAVAGLLVSLAGRLCKGRLPLALTVSLAAAHPSLALFAGGLVPGSEATALVALLLALRLALVGTQKTRRAALGLVAFLPLVRYDLVAFPIVVGVLLVREARGADVRARLRAAWPALALLAFPLLAWIVRTWIVSGRPFGTGYASHGFGLGRVPRNLLVVAGLVLPAAGLGVLWIFVPEGLRRLWNGKAADRPVVRTALVGVGVHLALVALFAGPTYAGDGSLAFSSGSLRFGLAAVPFVVLAASLGLAAKAPRTRGPVAAMIAFAAPVLAAWLLSGAVQRALPFKAQAAGRLHLLAEAYDAADAEAGPRDWIAVELAPRTNAGVEIFLGDRAPGRRTGVVAAAPRPRGIFPRGNVLPLRDGLVGGVSCWLVSDLEYEGMIYTGQRSDLGQGGQGIFHRIVRKEVRDGSAGAYTIHQVVRPPK